MWCCTTINSSGFGVATPANPHSRCIAFWSAVLLLRQTIYWPLELGKWICGIVSHCEPLAIVRAKQVVNRRVRLPFRISYWLPVLNLAEELKTIALESMNSPSPVQDVRLESTDLSAKVPSRTSTLLASAARILTNLSSVTLLGTQHQVQSDVGACGDGEPSFGVSSHRPVISFDSVSSSKRLRAAGLPEKKFPVFHYKL
jgi:hypothetical protein